MQRAVPCRTLDTYFQRATGSEIQPTRAAPKRLRSLIVGDRYAWENMWHGYRKATQSRSDAHRACAVAEGERMTLNLRRDGLRENDAIGSSSITCAVT